MKIHIIGIATTILALNHGATAMTGEEVLAKVSTKHAGLSSIRFSGKIVIHMEQPSAGDETIRFSAKLARPALYRVDWNDSPETPQGKGIAWSDGAQHFIQFSGLKPMASTFIEAAAGVSHGAADTMPRFFLNRPGNLFQNLKDLTLLPQETIGSDACQVLAGKNGSDRITLWITRDDLVRQVRKEISGKPGTAELPDDKLKDEVLSQARKLMSENAPGIPPEQQEQILKGAAEGIASAGSAPVNLTITETYEQIEVNQPMKEADFKPGADSATR